MTWPRQRSSFTFYGPDGTPRELAVCYFDALVIVRVENRMRERRAEVVKTSFPGDVDRMLAALDRPIPIGEVLEFVKSPTGLLIACVESILEANQTMSREEAETLCQDLAVATAMVKQLQKFPSGRPEDKEKPDRPTSAGPASSDVAAAASAGHAAPSTTGG